MRSPLDPKLRANALARVKLAMSDAAYHDKQAAAARSKAATITRTWQLCPIPDGSGFCCHNPDACEGRNQ